MSRKPSTHTQRNRNTHQPRQPNKLYHENETLRREHESMNRALVTASARNVDMRLALQQALRILQNLCDDGVDVLTLKQTALQTVTSINQAGVV